VRVQIDVGDELAWADTFPPSGARDRQGHAGAVHQAQVLRVPPRDGGHAPRAGRAEDGARRRGEEGDGRGRPGERRDHGRHDQGPAREQRRLQARVS
jgi:hypothetical protein